MKKISILVVALMAVGAVSSWAQETDKILFGPVPIALKAKLSDKATLTMPTSGTLEFATVQFEGSGFTSVVFDVIGTSIGLTNVPTGGSSTDIYLEGVDIWDDGEFGYGPNESVVIKSSSKSATSVGIFAQEQTDLFTFSGVSNANSIISNSVLFVTSTAPVGDSKTTNVTAKVTGIWVDGVNTISGTISTEKTKK